MCVCACICDVCAFVMCVCTSKRSIYSYLRYLNGCLTVSRITKYGNFVPSAN